MTGDEIRALAPETLTRLRARDDARAAPRLTTDTDGGTSLRCRLERSRPGETLALVSYAPLRRWAEETGAGPGPYDEAGPVFVHPPDRGGRAGAPGGCPDPMPGARRVLRTYAAKGRILGGLLVEPGRTAAGTVGESLASVRADPRVAVVHVRAVEFGCFLVETRRR